MPHAQNRQKCYDVICRDTDCWPWATRNGWTPCERGECVVWLPFFVVVIVVIVAAAVLCWRCVQYAHAHNNEILEQPPRNHATYTNAYIHEYASLDKHRSAQRRFIDPENHQYRCAECGSVDTHTHTRTCMCGRTLMTIVAIKSYVVVVAHCSSWVTCCTTWPRCCSRPCTRCARHARSRRAFGRLAGTLRALRPSAAQPRPTQQTHTHTHAGTHTATDAHQNRRHTVMSATSALALCASVANGGRPGHSYCWPRFMCTAVAGRGVFSVVNYGESAMNLVICGEYGIELP